MKFDLKEGLSLGEYASRAYDETPFKRMKAGTPWCVFLDGEQTDSRVLMEFNGVEIILSFRGTRDLQDWMQDGKVEKTNVLLKSPDTKDLLVHKGFLEDALSLYSKIAHRLTDTTMPLLITGHSKGAAEATIIAYMLGRRAYNIKKVVTYASPRVGNSGFKASYQRILGSRTFRVAAAGDLVPLVPGIFCPPRDGYRHVGNEVFLRPDGRYYVNPSRPFEIISDEWRAAKYLEHEQWDFLAKVHSIDEDYIPLMQACAKRLITQ